MPSPLSDDKRNHVKVLLTLGLGTKIIAQRANVSERQVRRIKQNLIEHETSRPPKVVPQGRPRLITLEMEEVYPPEPVRITT
jgi:transposase